MIRSIRLRLAIVSLLMITAGMAAIWLALGEIFERRLAGEVAGQLGGTIDFLAGQLESGADGPVLRQEPGDARYLIPAGGRYWQVGFDGAQTIRSRSLWDVEIDMDATMPFSFADLRTGTGPDGAAVLLRAQEFSLETFGPVSRARIAAAVNRAEFDEAVQAFTSELRVMLLITGGALFLASLLQNVIGLSPLRILQNNVAEVRAGRASRVAATGPSEVDPLVGEVNQLLEIRENDIENARHRASDLAHGIKTPLQLLAQYGETLEAHDPANARHILEQVAAIRGRVERQLALARMAANRKASVDLGILAGKLVGIVRRLPSEHELDWQVAIPRGLRAPVEEGDLSEALGNILDNARKWARSRVRISAAGTAESLSITIEDDGPGVAEDSRDLVLARGVRLDEKHSENGLGLAIAREIVEAYHGRIAVSRSGLGGLRLDIELPALK